MHVRLRCSAAALLLVPPLLLVGAGSAAAGGPASGSGGSRGLPATYTLTGDAGGSAFEGLDVAGNGRTFYVTETTGGEVHRGDVRSPRTEVWLDEAAAAAAHRTTARGIVADGQGRVFIAGGPNRASAGAPADAPDAWVYDRSGRLLASLRAPVAGANAVYLNDIVIGPDGAAYATNSNTPEVYRIAREHGQWRMRLWAKPANVVQTGPFGLNGIEVAPDGRSLVAVQSDKGALWRFDLRTRKASRIGAGTVDLTSGDGLVVRGTTLVVIRNNPHKLVYLRLTADARSARLLRVADTDPTRVFTTGDYASGRLLLIDSKFDEQPPKPPYQVVSLPYQPR